MTLSGLVGILRGETVVESETSSGRVVGSVVASDLMSDVLVMAQDGALLVTSLASEQMIRTADFVGAVGVVVVNGKALLPSVIDLARSVDVTLIRSPLSKYEACLAIGSVVRLHEEAES